MPLTTAHRTAVDAGIRARIGSVAREMVEGRKYRAFPKRAVETREIGAAGSVSIHTHTKDSRAGQSWSIIVVVVRGQERWYRRYDESGEPLTPWQIEPESVR
jgi:hypothetical protein